MPSYVDSAGVTNLTTSIKNMADATYPSNEAIASVYDSTASYAVGDYCIYNGLLYKCTTAISTGGETWNSAHWTASNVTGELGSGGDKIMYVNLTYSNYNYVSVETYDEILDAINNGYLVIVKYNNDYYYFAYVYSNQIHFRRFQVNSSSVYQYYYYVYKNNGATKWTYSYNCYNVSISSDYKRQPVIWVADNDDSESMATHPYVVSYSELEYFHYLSEIEGSNYPLLHYVKSPFDESYSDTGSTDANYEEYRLVKAWTTHEWDDDGYYNVWTAHVVFGTTAIENGVVKYKTFTFDGNTWDYINNMYPTYSETSLGLAPAATGVSF